MAKVERADYRRVGAAAAEPAPPFARTFRGRVALVLLCVGMLSLAYAPFKQFYLAWIGLVPWLVLVGRAASTRSAFLWSWVTGIGFFSVNIWWIGWVTIPGAMGLMLYMGAWFALNAWVLRGAGVLEVGDATKPQAAWRAALAVVVVAGTWVAQEWIRGNLFTGLPWLYLGHTQSPALAMCQVADLTSVYGVTFWVVLVNAWVALLLLHRLNPARLIGAGVLVVAVLAGTLAYGLFRMGQKTSYPGPNVMVVQPNYPQSNSGEKGAGFDEIVGFHVKTTAEALRRMAPEGGGGGEAPDLVAWSETMMPELNAAYRKYAYKYVFADDRDRVVGRFLDDVNETLERLSNRFGVSLIVGGHTMVERGKGPDGKPVFSRYNSAYYYTPAGGQAKERYDKIHLVPFGEFMPFRESFPLLYRALNVFNPYKDVDYTVESGKDLTVFQLPAKGQGTTATTGATGGPTTQPAAPGGPRFVTAICFEDVDSRLMARMFAGPDHTKRADFIVNLTNDGWFAFNQMPQHLQLAVFRSIENRVPTARAVNTGISGYIDPVGRVYDTIPVHTTGTRAARLELDRRVAPYTHVGDVFAGLCLAGSAMVVAGGVWRGVKKRRAAGR